MWSPLPRVVRQYGLHASPAARRPPFPFRYGLQLLNTPAPPNIAAARPQARFPLLRPPLPQFEAARLVSSRRRAKRDALLAAAPSLPT